MKSQWFAAIIKSNHEKQSSKLLVSRSIEHFLPLYSQISNWRRGEKKLIERPLFPGYIFVHIPRYQRTIVLETPGVLQIVSNHGHMISLEDSEIERLRLGLCKVNARPADYLSVGEQVRIAAGPLQGFNGILLRRKNLCEVVISVEMIQRSVSVEIAEADLEKVAFHSTRLQ